MDQFSAEERSRIMARVGSKDTTPEVAVRSMLFRMGFRFRIHRKDLPGTPDIVLPKYRTAVFVHGCFWHRHKGCKRASTPATKTEYWLPKFERTLARDTRNQAALRKLGWRVLIVWECQLRDAPRLQRRLLSFLRRSQG